MTIKVGGYPVRQRLAFAIALGLVVLLLIVVTQQSAEPVQAAVSSSAAIQLGPVASLVALVLMFPAFAALCVFPSAVLVVGLIAWLAIVEASG